MKDSCQCQTWFAGSALLLAVLALAGRGDRAYPVEGKVIYHPDGRAAVELVGCTIDFDPITEGKKLGATGVINKDGSFTVGTHTGDDGAVVGARLAPASSRALDRALAQPSRPGDRRSERDPSRCERAGAELHAGLERSGGR